MNSSSSETLPPSRIFEELQKWAGGPERGTPEHEMAVIAVILPTKHIAQDRALLTVGARILPELEQPLTVSSLWDRLARKSRAEKVPSALRYDSFVLALDLLFLLGTIQLRDGLLQRTAP